MPVAIKRDLRLAAHARQILAREGVVDVVMHDRPQVGVVVADQAGDRGDRHLLGQRHHERFEQQREARLRHSPTARTRCSGQPAEPLRSGTRRRQAGRVAPRGPAVKRHRLRGSLTLDPAGLLLTAPTESETCSGRLRGRQALDRLVQQRPELNQRPVLRRCRRGAVAELSDHTVVIQAVAVVSGLRRTAHDEVEEIRLGCQLVLLEVPLARCEELGRCGGGRRVSRWRRPRPHDCQRLLRGREDGPRVAGGDSEPDHGVSDVGLGPRRDPSAAPVMAERDKGSPAGRS